MKTKYENMKLLLIALISVAVAVAVGHPQSLPSSSFGDPHALSSRFVLPPTDGDYMDGFAKGKYTPPEEKRSSFWKSKAQAELQKRLELQKQSLKLGRAKNIIMFLGDGMSLSTITAARILKGQRQHNTGEEDALGFEQFPYSGLSKTYCANAQVADSSCTATAYLTGVKTNICTTGVSANVNYNDCAASMNEANHLKSLADWAQAAGKATGIVTNSRVTHASPSAAYAHVANRMWESDADIGLYAKKENPATCMDIAQQLISQSPGRDFDVVMGGGMEKFLPNTVLDKHGQPGERLDGKNLLAQWQAQHANGTLIWNRSQLLQLDVSKVDHIMGLFQPSLMNFHLLANASYEPTLEEMTEVAIKKLSRNANGFFLFVENDLIDYGHHYNMAELSLDETIEFDKAIMKARAMTSADDTLIVVTSDHAHPFTLSGYSGRGTDILGLNEHETDDQGVPYTTLQYASGSQQYLDALGKRVDLSTASMQDPSFVFPSYVNSMMGKHAGDDVGIFASGPYEHLFTGFMEQNTIPHMMAYAACIGEGKTMCDEQCKCGKNC